MIVGDGFLRYQLEQLVKGFGLESKVIFTGSVQHSEIPEYIAAADVCVAPFKDTEVSRSKSPLKIVEYMAMEKPIIASNVGEVRRMVGGIGLLVGEGSEKELSNAILKVLNNRNLRQGMMMGGRRRIQTKYNWRNTSENILKAYEVALRDN